MTRPSLEDEFRAGLQRRADDVDTTVDLLGPVQEAGRGRRRRAWVAGSVGLAAAALVTAAVVQSAGTDKGTDGGTPPVADDPPTEPLPTEWRTEAWHGLQVEVPADWAWGAGPIDVRGTSIRCGGPDGDGALRRPPGRIESTCAKEWTSTSTSDSADYVWLDVDRRVRNGGPRRWLLPRRRSTSTARRVTDRHGQPGTGPADPRTRCDLSRGARPACRALPPSTPC